MPTEVCGVPIVYRMTGRVVPVSFGKESAGGRNQLARWVAGNCQLVPRRASQVHIPDDDLAALAAAGGPHAVRRDVQANQRADAPIEGGPFAPALRLQDAHRAV